ncbi:hypothetical protein QJU93_07245 [Pasteurella skyensis]|uniref:BRCT domain-containing protein n=1 Tax=Phocoenobacter skyensis TaxID=97481 RepID=A0AAJ6NAL5_9PAST|nr:hypothetical protein [Pasteurella skyensis]MDP8173151.1 hypothetical protein [Pasteurella skyensis]MDP8178916.1 hypothetical protein [Pasteurella skyensis]
MKEDITVCFLGFSAKKKREYETISQQKYGYHISNTLSDKVDYLIYGDVDDELILKAQSLNVECCDEEAFLILSGESS